MKKFIALILMSTAMLYTMEEYPDIENDNYGEPITNDYVLENLIALKTKEQPELDINLQEQLLIDEAIRQSIEIEEQVELHKVIDDSRIATWEIMPLEVKLHIFSFIPKAMKHIMLISKESKSLTEDRIFLEILAAILVKEKLEKAIKTLGYAIESENYIITKALLKANIEQSIIQLADYQNSFITEAQIQISHTELFAKSILSLNPEVAHIMFVKAAQKNNITLVQAFITANINIDDANNTMSNNALIEASIRGNYDIARLLLDHGAQVHTKNKYGYSALHYAALNGKYAIAELFLNHPDINMEAQTNVGTTPLIIAARLDHKPIVELLIAYNANVNAEEVTKHTALMYACLNGNLEIVQLLLGHQALAQAKTGQAKSWFSMTSGLSAWHYYNKKQKLSTSNFGYTALMFACEQGHEMIIEELLQHCDINDQNEDGFTALECVLNKYATHPHMHEKFKKIIDLLITNGANIAKQQLSCVIF